MPTKHTEKIRDYDLEITVGKEKIIREERGDAPEQKYTVKFEITIEHQIEMQRFDPMIKYAHRLLEKENGGPTSEITSMGLNSMGLISAFVIRGELRQGFSKNDYSYNKWMISTVEKVGRKVEARFFMKQALRR